MLFSLLKNLFGSSSALEEDARAAREGRFSLFPELDDSADAPTRFPEHYIGTGYFPGDTQYCIHDGRIYEGFMPGGKCIANITEDGRIFEGYFGGQFLAYIDEFGHIYAGDYSGRCLGCIVDGRIYLDSPFPTGSAAFNIY